ncbi:MAG: hypothetical protein GY705_24890 [Bacteroidetes bacterium]|nr:hypothetical protein [Bacteroidota bacterium]
MKIAHIVNVTEINESKKSSYLHIAQPVTLKSMSVAKEMAREKLDIELFAVKHKSEIVDIPDSFCWTKDLESYAYDYILALEKSNTLKPLPCIVDILTSLHDASEADFFIYTNVDIGLKPNFYLEVMQFIEQGFDAFCINRRDIPKKYRNILIDADNLELGYMIKGLKHPGVDCFVFKRDIVQKLLLNKVFVGFPPVGNVLKSQIKQQSKKFAHFKNAYLTFHLGRDRAWKSGNSPYHIENLNQARGLYKKKMTKKVLGLINSISQRLK